MTTLIPGTPVPDFSLPATDGQTFRLSDFHDKAHVVIYFYPKDHTPGCTLESQGFRDAHAQFQAAGAEVFGISRDSLRSHASFKARETLPFALLADTESSVCQLFDVIRPKKLYGKTFMGLERSTFVIDSAGVLRHVWRKVRVQGHVEEVLAAVRNLPLPPRFQPQTGQP